MSCLEMQAAEVAAIDDVFDTMVSADLVNAERKYEFRSALLHSAAAREYFPELEVRGYFRNQCEIMSCDARLSVASQAFFRAAMHNRDHSHALNETHAAPVAVPYK